MPATFFQHLILKLTPLAPAPFTESHIAAPVRHERAHYLVDESSTKKGLPGPSYTES